MQHTAGFLMMPSAGSFEAERRRRGRFRTRQVATNPKRDVLQRSIRESAGVIHRSETRCHFDPGQDSLRPSAMDQAMQLLD
jgi:hypothetical protein